MCRGNPKEGPDEPEELYDKWEGRGKNKEGEGGYAKVASTVNVH